MESRIGQRLPGQADEAGPGARPLPLQAAVGAHVAGWSVRLPVRAEHVSVTKEAVFLEEVRVWRARHQEIQAVKATQRTERLVVDDSEMTR